MTTSSQPPRRRILSRLVLVLAGLLLAAIACLLVLALVEATTQMQPLSRLIGWTLGYTRQPASSTVADASPAVTFTPTPVPPPTDTPIPPTPTPPPPTPTPTDTATATSSPTPAPPSETPTATLPPTDTPTATQPPTNTPTATLPPTATPTPNSVATATAAVQATATARTRATALARTPTVTRAPATPAAPPAGRVSGSIAFPVFDANRQTYDLYLANADGAGMRRLFAQASAPSLSPNGQRLAYRNWQADQRGIITVNMDGSNGARRTEYLEDGAAVWSPDSGRLTFFSRREADRQPRLFSQDINLNAEAQVLLQNFAAIYGEMPSWLADGRVVYKATSPEMGIGVVNADGSGFRMLAADASATAPSGSRTGPFVVFMSQRDGNWEIYRVNQDGGGLTRLTQNPASDGLPVWSPDGRSIAFASNRSGAWAIWAMNADGSNQRQLFALPGPLDGRVGGEPDFVHRGWVEERISWGP